jgi:hypothetical protein
MRKTFCSFMRFIGVLAVIATTLFYSCKEKSKEPQISNFYDPFEASFWGKNIKFMLTNTRSGTDTTTFDIDGNIVRVQFFQRDQVLRKFDSHHRVIKQMEKGEFFKHFIFSYDTIENYIIKEIKQLSNLEWDDNAEGAEIRKTFLLVSRTDELGRIIEEVDTYVANTITNYTYKDDQLVEKKELYILGEGRSDEARLKRWKFFYKAGILEKTEIYFGRDLNSTHYFDDNGLLEFSIEKAKPGYPDDTLSHRYIYY